MDVNTYSTSAVGLLSNITQPAEDNMLSCLHPNIEHKSQNVSFSLVRYPQSPCIQSPGPKRLPDNPHKYAFDDYSILIFLIYVPSESAAA